MSSILATQKIKISMLVSSGKQLAYAKQKYKESIQNFLDTSRELSLDAYIANNYNLTYIEIEQYRPTQLKVEHYLQRNRLDYNFNLYAYYNALSFWLDFFSKNKIDMVFRADLEHGALHDSIILDIAKNKKIPVFGIEMNSSSYTSSLCSLSLTTPLSVEFINLSKIKLPKISPNDFLLQIEQTFANYQQKKITLKRPFRYFRKVFLGRIPAMIIQTFRSTLVSYKREREREILAICVHMKPWQMQSIFIISKTYMKKYRNNQTLMKNTFTFRYTKILRQPLWLVQF